MRLISKHSRSECCRAEVEATTVEVPPRARPLAATGARGGWRAVWMRNPRRRSTAEGALRAACVSRGVAWRVEKTSRSFNLNWANLLDATVTKSRTAPDVVGLVRQPLGFASLVSRRWPRVVGLACRRRIARGVVDHVHGQLVTVTKSAFRGRDHADAVCGRRSQQNIQTSAITRTRRERANARA